MDEGLGTCLDNEPLVTVADPVCGNGIRERDEICDCGTPQVRREEKGGGEMNNLSCCSCSC